MRGRCRESGCNTKWNTVEEYLKCEGCSWHGCKIAENFERRKQNNAAIETEKVINKMKTGDSNQFERSGEYKVFTKTSPVHMPYTPAENEAKLDRPITPMMTFRIMK